MDTAGVGGTKDGTVDAAQTARRSHSRASSAPQSSVQSTGSSSNIAMLEEQLARELRAAPNQQLDVAKLESVLDELVCVRASSPSAQLGPRLRRVVEALAPKKRGRRCARLALQCLQRIAPSLPASVRTSHANDVREQSVLAFHSMRILRACADPDSLFTALTAASASQKQAHSTSFTSKELKRAPECGLVDAWLRGALACYASGMSDTLPDDDLLSAALCSADGCAAANALKVVERRAASSPAAVERLLQQRVAHTRRWLVSNEPLATRMHAVQNPTKGLNLESKRGRCLLARIAGHVVHSHEVVSRGVEAGRQTFMDTLKELMQDHESSVALAAVRALFAADGSIATQREAWELAMSSSTPTDPAIASGSTAAAFAAELTRHFVRSSSEPIAAEGCECAKIVGRAACAAGSMTQLRDELLELARSVLQVLQQSNSAHSLHVRALEAMVYLPGATDGRLREKLITNLQGNHKHFLKEDLRRILCAMADRIQVDPEESCKPLLDIVFRIANEYTVLCDAGAFSHMLEEALIVCANINADQAVFERLVSLLYDMMTPQKKQSDGIDVPQNDVHSMQACIGHLLGEYANRICLPAGTSLLDGCTTMEDGLQASLDNEIVGRRSHTERDIVTDDMIAGHNHSASTVGERASHKHCLHESNVQLTTLEFSRAAAEVNPLLRYVINALACACACCGWEVQVVCTQALEKIAIRSNEPFRFVCYQQLKLMCDRGAGVMSQAYPALSYLDAMYRSIASLRMKQSEEDEQNIIEWVMERHRVLLHGLQSRCKLDKDRFLPLGSSSRQLVQHAIQRFGKAALTKPRPGDIDHLTSLLNGQNFFKEHQGRRVVWSGFSSNGLQSALMQDNQQHQQQEWLPEQSKEEQDKPTQPIDAKDTATTTAAEDGAPDTLHEAQATNPFGGDIGDAGKLSDHGTASAETAHADGTESMELDFCNFTTDTIDALGSGEEFELDGVEDDDTPIDGMLDERAPDLSTSDDIRSGIVMACYYDATSGIEFEEQTPIDVIGEDESGQYYLCQDMFFASACVPKRLVHIEE